MKTFSYIFAGIAAVSFIATITGAHHQFVIFIIASIMYITLKKNDDKRNA